MSDIAMGAAAEAPTKAKAAPLAAGERLAAIDMLRGLVIAIMALDHVRDYVHAQAYQFDPLDLTRTYPALYATRWVTHFCAPTFVFLSGVSAYLQSTKGKTGAKLSGFLFTRGLWLIFLELTLVGWAWSFWPLGVPFLQVIWAIGWSMIALSALVWLPRLAVLAIGVGVIALHNLSDPLTPQQFGPLSWLWIFLDEGGFQTLNGAPIAFDFYPVLPWAGVMAFGYGVGEIFTRERAARDRTLIVLGAAMIALFFLLRSGNFYGDPKPWSHQTDLSHDVMSFLDVQKYPPSLLYVCATLGPVFVLFPLLARLQGPLAKVLLAYGSVPLFTYVLHIYIVHAVALIAGVATGYDAGIFVDYFRHLFSQPGDFAGFGFSLPIVYLVWLGVLALLYPLSAWWASVKRNRRDWWLSYL
ncbi:MAG TPA: heparan-alpha-glucosaminide N-acetyltransferase domain-containing protein [Caulobacterales bacterium]|nr:heparan-alpha-glucosaminide N-acetyltransferase domain-containing protein [Caulobacterales bacterium]